MQPRYFWYQGCNCTEGSKPVWNVQQEQLDCVRQKQSGNLGETLAAALVPSIVGGWPLHLTAPPCQHYRFSARMLELDQSKRGWPAPPYLQVCCWPSCCGPWSGSVPSWQGPGSNMPSAAARPEPGGHSPWYYQMSRDPQNSGNGTQGRWERRWISTTGSFAGARELGCSKRHLPLLD